MPRWDRKRHDRGRRAEIPSAVTACLAAVNDADNPEWHRRLDLVRAWRRAEWESAADNAMVTRHDGGRALGDESGDPPYFEDAAIWLIGQRRDIDLCRCLECRRWFLARHNRSERCGALPCRRAHTLKRQAEYRARTFGAN